MRIIFSMIAFGLFIPGTGEAHSQTRSSQHAGSVAHILHVISEQCDDERAEELLETASELRITRRDSGYGEVSCSTYHVGQHVRISDCRSGSETQEYSLRTHSASQYGKNLLIVRNESECRIVE